VRCGQIHLVVSCLILAEILLMRSYNWPEFLASVLACEFVVLLGME
jgi:hypothetical protein